MSYLPDYRSRSARNYARNYSGGAFTRVNSFNSTSEARDFSLNSTASYAVSSRPKARKLSSVSKKPLTNNRNSKKAGVFFKFVYIVCAVLFVFITAFSLPYGFIVSQIRITGRETVKVENEIRLADKRINELNIEKNRIAPIMSLEGKAAELGMTETEPVLVALEKKNP